MSVLEDLYNGNISPQDRYVKKGGEYEKINTQLMEHIEKLLSTLTTEQKNLYESVEENAVRLACISERESFIDGFKLGALLMWEIINFKSNNFL